MKGAFFGQIEKASERRVGATMPTDRGATSTSRTQFPAAAEEAAAHALVRELGGFTLAVEQIAVFLELHPGVR